jgi:hypothetical protein
MHDWYVPTLEQASVASGGASDPLPATAVQTGAPCRDVQAKYDTLG